MDRFYGVGKRGLINAAPAAGNIWAPRDMDPFGEAWDRENTPESNWSSLTTDPESGVEQDQYYSPGATFLASEEFANHPDNPIDNHRIFSNGGDERMNHVSVNLLDNDLLEVFFYVREARKSDPDDYNAIYRIVYDVSEPDFQDWTVARDESGSVLFDVVLTPEDVTAAVESAVGSNFDANSYADPVSLGDTEVFIDENGAKYLFFSYVSDEYGGAQGEGAITAVRLISTVPGDFDVDGDVDADDINFYSGKIGEDIDGNLMFLDLNGDGTIGLDDHDQHITTLAQTSNGETGTLIGDINLDGTVNVLGDAFILVSNLNSTGPNLYSAGDLNGDQKIDVLGDAFRLVGGLGQSNSSGASANTAAVPEPGSIALLAIAGLGTMLRRRR